MSINRSRLGFICFLLFIESTLSFSWTPSPAGEPTVVYYEQSWSAGEFICTSGGGLWHRRGASEGWEVYNQSLGVPLGSHIYFVKSADDLGDTLFASGSSLEPVSGSWFSTDAGSTWHSVPLEWRTTFGTSQLLVSRYNTLKWYHLSDRYLRTSNDAGATWQEFELDGHERIRTNIIEDPYSDSTLYVFSQVGFASPDQPNGELLVSYDQGNSWQNILNLAATFGASSFRTYDLLHLPSGRLVLSIPLSSGNPELASGILISDDGGLTWNSASQGLPWMFSAEELVLLPGTENEIITGSRRQWGPYVSRNGGDTWAPFDDGLPEHRNDTWLSTSSDNSTILAYVSNSGVYRLNPNTEAWQRLDLDTGTMGAGGTLGTTATNVYLCERTNRMWRHTGNTNQWSERELPMHLDEVVSYDPPLNWNNDSLLALARSSFNIFEPDTCWFAVSSDNGVNWDAEYYGFPCRGMHYNVYVLQGTRYLVAHNRDELLFKSDISGQWLAYTPPEPFEIKDITANSENFFVLLDDRFSNIADVHMINASGEWESMNYTGQHLGYKSQIWSDGESVFVGASSLCVKFTSELGWISLGTIPRMGAMLDILVVPSNPPVFVGLVYLSTVLTISLDQGDSWDNYDMGSVISEQCIEIMSLAVDSVSDLLWASSPLGTAYVTFEELNSLAHSSIERESRVNKVEIGVSPNPTNSLVNVSLNMQHNKQVSLQLVNTRGQIVDVVFQGRLAAGRSDMSVSLSKWSSGIYFLRAVTSDSQSLVKICLLK